jgi:hypothetical protein
VSAHDNLSFCVSMGTAAQLAWNPRRETMTDPRLRWRRLPS